MKHVRIYQPAKTAMQSGRAKTTQWVIDPALPTARRPEPLMGWVSAADTLNTLKLRFGSKEQAVAYAEQQGWSYDIEPAQQKRVKPRNYTDNFKYIAPEDKA